MAELLMNSPKEIAKQRLLEALKADRAAAIAAGERQGLLGRNEAIAS